jgi:hypothetical protein
MWPFLPKKCNCPTTPTNPNTNCNHNGLYAKDLVYQGVDIPCAEIYSGMNMSEVLQRLDYYVCGIGFTQQVLDIIQENPQEFNEFITLVNGAINCETINACGPVPTTTTTSTTEVIVTTTTTVFPTTTSTTTDELTTTTTTTLVPLTTTTTTSGLGPMTTTTTTTDDVITYESFRSSSSDSVNACSLELTEPTYIIGFYSKVSDNISGIPGFNGGLQYWKVKRNIDAIPASVLIDTNGNILSISFCP